jgi:hypothetical protein
MPVLWHIFSRGARRLVLFEKDQDYLVFLTVLAQAVAASGATLIGYTLMTNHYHLMLRATSAQRTSCMRRLNYLFAKYFNREHALSGHAFDAPYKAYVQRSLVLALYKLAYIFLNPFRAGMTSFQGNYRWSSAGSYLGGDPGPLPVDPLPLYELMKVTPEVGRLTFQEIHRRESLRPARAHKQVMTTTELYRQQYTWLLELADDRRDSLEGEDPTRVAMLWARSVGIPPRAMLQPTAERSAHSVSQSISQHSKRLQAEGRLDRILALLD